MKISGMRANLSQCHKKFNDTKIVNIRNGQVLS